MKTDSKPSHWQDWTVFGLRWVLLIVIGLVIYLYHTQPALARVATLPPSTNILTDLAIPLGIGIVANVILLILIFIPSLNPVASYAIMLGDWAMTWGFVNLSRGDPALIVGIAGSLVVVGLLRLGATMGTVQSVGVVIAAGIALVVKIGPNNIGAYVPNYLPTILIVVLLIVVVGVWVYFQEEYSKTEKRQIEKTASQSTVQIADAEKRMRAVAEMANTLSATLSFDKVLDAALNIGDSLRRSTKDRMVSLVLLFEESGENLYVATSRGLKHTDEHRNIGTRSGIIAEALEGTTPVIKNNTSNDPELVTFSAFAGIRSMVCIPMRAGFDTFGVIVYGSDNPKAFNESQAETLKAIGTQATIALKNAVLYTNLMEQRDRVIQLEEDARKALARDLHDAPAQTIAVVKMDIEIIQKLLKVKPDKVPEELEKVKERAQRANDEIRHVLSSLYPLALENMGLIGAVQQHAKSMESKFNQRVDLNLPPEIEGYFSKQHQGVIYYLITEAVENASKHAEAKVVSVNVKQQGNDMVIRIADNGKGMDLDATRRNERGRYGMENMQRRAESLDGMFQIESQLGRGTRITVIIPIREQQYSLNNMPSTKLAAAARDSYNSMRTPRR